MGTLRHRRTGAEHALSSQHLVGRAPGCGLQLDNDMTSGHHAELRWTGAGWELRDLDSRNGTFLDHGALDRGERRKLAVGSLIAFGDPEDVFELTSDHAPAATAVCADGRQERSQGGTLLLPSAEAPQCFLLHDSGSWSMELPDGTVREVTTGEAITLDGAVWTLDLPIALAPTRQLDALLLETATLRFLVSRNEEHVELELIDRTQREHLSARSYWYTLLTLARARLRDRGEGHASEGEEGWLYVDDLVDSQLLIRPELLYQHVCRIKRAFARTGVVDYARIVERRPSTRQIRIGAPNLEVVTL